VSTSPDRALAADESCPVCGQQGPTPILTLRKVPVACNALAHSRDDALTATTGDIVLGFCGACSMIWNVGFRDSIIGYDAAYENSLHFSPVFERYASDLAQSLVDRYDLEGRRVVEIASGKGDFLALLCEAGVGRAAGFDPSYDGENDGRIDHDRVVVESRQYRPSDAANADLVCARHFLEHVPDPRGMLESIAEQLDPDRSVVYLEMPDAGYMLRATAVFDVLYEHCTYFTGHALSEALDRTGLVAARIGTSFGGQYLWAEARPAAGRAGLVTEQCDDAALEPLADLQSRAAGFARDADAVISRAAEVLERFSAEGREVVVWGAGTKGVMFLNTVPGAERTSRVVDANPRKRGRFVPCTGQEVVTPDDLRITPPGAVVVTNPLYRGEIATSLAALGIDVPVAAL